MEKDTIVPLLIGALILATLGLLMAVGILAYLLLKRTNPDRNQNPTTNPCEKQQGPEEGKNDNAPIPALINNSFESTHSTSDFGHTEGYCSNHCDIPARGTCAICGELFCENCLKNYEVLHFCGEHYQLFLNHKWVEVETIKTSPNDPERGLALYSFKEKLWRESKIPSYIMTQYKIDIENDLIESHIKLYAKDSDRQALQKPLILKREHQ
ncbi:MAG: hypothetical protein HYV97_17565 [Bdellovibrio sp.]|nr:hypothetical protein [Bdellovibrio sp.]